MVHYKNILDAMTSQTRAVPPPPIAAPTPSPTVISAAMERRRRLLCTVENLRGRVRQVLKCVINLHIEFLVLESNVAALLDDVRALNADCIERERLDRLIETLRNYNGPTICHEWPYPLIFKGTIDEAHVAQVLNAAEPVAGVLLSGSELMLPEEPAS
ncbi:uncharacterized protein LOC115622962 [Scaptodrosophila lebanonensis]|uniref:Uncharacterized protein LOC115622962 n=1 Tax=Drosophila lebanonensis TaxID=7225 RepID=A0A6J2TC59_DROLE|nr:uncharacterized protein LOC115622962 [Scaptodrosophila lebanonensis]XP_030372970.1 uncharacterized protein LOC115622962 [Scaptodrosophila lebanonensis]